ncbi:MAG TPA: SGNH/GDSL hydrolase family protein [Pyrinomonadaceae bacterium]|nr:SGNH/GDSL hydrolase family protein [Pyrinomonadaceae bacterium]
MAHIVLLGDSIFDNKTYVDENGKDVVTHLRESLPNDWQATLKAIDGSIIENVSKQLFDAPPNSTHLVVSVGGNNVIMNADVLQMKAENSAQVLSEIADRRETFESHYKEMLQRVLAKKLPTAVCTVYFPNFPEAIFQRLAVTALSVFNDVIIRQAIINRLPIIDLRLICSEADDYANEIEPSDKGGRKIAAKILELVETHDFKNLKTQIFA